jgi:hypothetical protein
MVTAKSPGAKEQLLAVLDDLPPEIVVPAPRLLVQSWANFDLRRRVNYLTAEALAAALVISATIRVAVEAPLLRDACEELGMEL